MRSRSRLVSFPAVHAVGGEIPVPQDGSNWVPQFSFMSYFGSKLSDSFVTDCRELHSTMIDDSTPLSECKFTKYKSCSHVKNSGIWIDFPISYGFTPPTPAFHGKIKGYICFVNQPPAIKGVQWDTLVDSLAKQVTESLTSKFMGGVFLKELRETVTMIRNPFGLLTKTMVRKLPRGISAHTGSSLKKYSSLFLEYRYGWRPLYSDVCEFSKLLAHYYVRGDLQRSLVTWSKFRAGKLMDPPSESLKTLYPTGSNKSQWETIAAKTDYWHDYITGCSGLLRLIPNKTEYKASVTCRHLRPQVEVASVLRDILNVLQLGTWRQVRDSLWEVLPLSFVVDWFVNLGGIWRSQAEADLCRADVRDVGYSIKSSVNFNLEILPLHPQFLEYSDTTWSRYAPNPNNIVSGPPIYSASCTTTSSHWSYYQRTPGLPPGGDTVLSASGLDLLHGLDGLSLMIQKMPKPH